MDYFAINRFMSFKPVIIKRNNAQEDYSRRKIKLSIFSAAVELGGKDLKLADILSREVEKILIQAYGHRDSITTEEIGDVVEIVLIKKGHAKTAKQYILSRAARRKVADLAKRIGIIDDIGGLSPNSLLVMKNKYLLKDETGQVIETPLQMLKRVADFVAKAEKKNKRQKWSRKFLDLMKSRRFLPAGRILTNAGTKDGQLANCFVLPIEDSVKGVFQTLQESAILKKHGGAVGVSFSKIRPKGDYIQGSSGRACGPVAIMKLFNDSSDILLQHGQRRSGNMVVLNVTHPDVLEFITSKEDSSRYPHINFSLAVTSKFMQAALSNKDWPLVNPRIGRIVSTIKARSILELAATYAWHNGDPGLIFIDEINKHNPTPKLGPIEAVNLCGEQPLLAYEACNLGSINLVSHLKKANIDPVLGQLYDLDWQKLAETVKTAVRFLDDTINVTKFPLKKIKKIVESNRKIGLGIIGWSDVLIKMGISYKDEKARKLAEKIMKFIRDFGWQQSAEIGREKSSFPNFKGSIWQSRGYSAFRNATVTTIAPTGTIAIIAMASYGIEPLFALSFYKEAMGGVKLPEINSDLFKVLKWLELHNKISKSQAELVKKEVIKKGSIQKIDFLPPRVKDVFVTAMDLTPLEHIKMQAAWQKYVDNAVSKTINLPNSASVQDVINAFVAAWKFKCKGITVYRDGSRQVQVLNVGSQNHRSKPRAGSNILTDWFKKTEQAQAKEITDTCPMCGAKMQITEGCKVCPMCGFSACSV